MAGFIAAATQFLNRNAPLVWAPSPDLPSRSSDRHASSQGSQGSRKSLKVPSRPGSSSGSSFASASDVSSHRARDTATSVGSGTLSGPMDATDVDALSCSPECDHTCCLPPRLVYSPASSSSLALSDTPLPITPLGLGLSPNVGFPLLTPDGAFHLNPNALPDIKKPGGTLAERRGAKALALQSAPALSDLPQPTGLLTPRTPDSASSFAQRLVGFIRSPTPESSLATPPTPEYRGDPFGGRSSSFYNDPYFFATVPVCPHPDLYDFDVYSTLPARPQNPIAKTCGKGSRVRLFVAASDLQLDDSDGAVSPPSSQAHSAPCAPSPSLDRPDSLSPPSTPISASPLTFDLPRSTPTVTAAAAGNALSGFPSSSLPYLRPLLLPQKFAQREIADAQSASILSHATPNLRPLILPQELARRASQPHISRRSRPHPRLRPRPASYPPSAAVLRSHQAPFHMGTITEEPVSCTSPEPMPRPGCKEIQSFSRAAVPGRKEQRRSQQIDDIISLLGQSGIIQEPEANEEHDQLDGVLSDTDESIGLATPPSILSQPRSSSSFSFISHPPDTESALSIEVVMEDPQEEAKKVEDILELLSSSPRGEGRAGSKADAEVVDDGVVEETICAYAI
ncbi:hypothetical protein GY45DRAFT_1084591 [Cubamyces sp. BRFM 1775]|nr:hypothetical protein GY45DRAFT_1084591 [Cubamyces sp. BRFM 1775]